MPNYLYISWERFHLDTQALASTLKEQAPFERIVAVTRGGLAPAALLSQMLDIRFVDTLCLASYGDDHAQSDLVLLKDACPEKGRVLVIDDLADSGKTSHYVRALLPNAYIAVLYAKPVGEPSVDTFVHRVAQDQWIVFPWEESAQEVARFPTHIF